jgi:hypothetical protein
MLGPFCDGEVFVVPRTEADVAGHMAGYMVGEYSRLAELARTAPPKVAIRAPSNIGHHVIWQV